MELREVGVRYGRRSPWVLQDVRLDLAPGDLVEVTGRNGAGKSSLLRVLAGVLPPGRGRVTGRPAVVGWAPERFPAEQPWAVGGYLRASAAVRGLRAGEGAAAVAREVERLHLGPLLRTPLGELSQGSRQKVGLAQAVLVRPGLLVLDEPWAGLDADARTALPGLVGEVRDAGGCVVVTDHHQQAAALHPSVQWHVADGAVQAAAPSATAAHVVVEVAVPAEAAAGLLADLQARGLEPRVR